MPTDLTVVLTDEPGQLAKLGQMTGEAGVNIQGMCAFTGEGRGIIHLLVSDSAAGRAAEALKQAGMRLADQRPVLVVDVEDRPGSFRLAGHRPAAPALGPAGRPGAALLLAATGAAPASSAVLDAGGGQRLRRVLRHPAAGRGAPSGDRGRVLLQHVVDERPARLVF